MARRKNAPPVKSALFPPDCADIIAAAMTRFKGQGPELESAIGMLYLGHVFGWKVLYVLHSVATVKKYEDFLDIKVKERFAESTDYSERSMGFRIAKTLTNFWRVVRGLDWSRAPGANRSSQRSI